MSNSYAGSIIDAQETRSRRGGSRPTRGHRAVGDLHFEKGSSVPWFDGVIASSSMGLRLEYSLVERDWDDSAIERNLTLGYQQRWDNAVAGNKVRGEGEERLCRVG